MYFIKHNKYFKLVLTMTLLLTQALGLYIVETDLDETLITNLEAKHQERLEWYMEFNSNRGHRYLALLYAEADGIYLFPKSVDDDITKNRTELLDIISPRHAPYMIIFKTLGKLIDVASDYPDYVVFDTVQPQNNLGLNEYLAEAIKDAEENRSEVSDALQHAKFRLTAEVKLDERKHPVYPPGGLVKRDRRHDCEHPTQYVSGTGDFEQDRSLYGYNVYLGGYADGQVYCGRNVGPPLINGYTTEVTGVCHTTVSHPVAYSFKADNGSPCGLQYITWEHHGCRLNSEDFHVSNNVHYAFFNAHVYSWTVDFDPC